jgi:ribosome-associated protein
MEKLSKTQKKKQAVSLQDLGEKLVKLTGEQLGRIELPEEVLSAVTLAKTIRKRGARKRQMQYIGVLMRKTDGTSIQKAVQNLEEGDRRQAELHKRVEQWRDELLRGNDAVIEEIVRALPNAEKEQLTGLVMKAREELTKTSPSPALSRALFRYLHKSAQQPKSASRPGP